MGSVFAAVLLELFEQADFVELIIAVGVLDAVEAAAAVLVVVDHDVEGVEGVAHAPGMADIEVDFLDIGVLEGFSRGGCFEAVNRAVLVAGDETAFVVLAESDPRAELVFWNRVEPFDFESFGDVESVRSRDFILGSADGNGEERGEAYSGA